MIRVCSVCIIRIKFNIDLSFIEMRRFYWMRFIQSQREREKESGRVGQSSSKELWKFRKNETNSGGRLFLVKYIYICNRFLMYEILLWQLRLVSTICIFCHQNQTFKQCCFFNQKSSFCPRDFQILYSPLFSFFCHCWFYRRSWFMTNSKVYRIITSLNWSLKTDSFHGKI